MDPTANLEEQLHIADGFVDGDFESDALKLAKAERLAELVIALDEWIRKGGFLPDAWLATQARLEAGVCPYHMKPFPCDGVHE